MQSLDWLNSRTIVTIDISEKLHVLDVRSEEELEAISIDKVQMVYSSAIFKALDNELDVSRAMSAGAKRACYYSTCISSSTLLNNVSANLLILGVNSVHLFAIRNWAERIDNLIKDKCFIEAMALTFSIYENNAKAVIGLTGKKSEKRNIVAQKMAEVINSYIDHELSLLEENDQSDKDYLKEYYGHLICTVVDFCLSIEENHYLLNDLYDRFSDDCISKKAFLEALEPHVLKGFLNKLSPILANDLIAYYEENKWLANIETVVTHLDISSLDIHHVMTLCQKNSLFDAIIHIHINAFDDYLTPFNQLIQRMRLALDSEFEMTDQEIELGNKLILYIGTLLKGLSFPLNKELDADKKERVIKQILSRVLSPTNTDKYPNSCSQRTIYPNLQTLLRFDAKQFLNTISNAFETFDVDNPFL